MLADRNGRMLAADYDPGMWNDQSRGTRGRDTASAWTSRVD